MEIEARIDRNGAVHLEYSGFKGDLCFDEAGKLLKRLRRLGLDVDVKMVRKKDEAYIRQSAKAKAYET
jgi:hypothetical protein